MNTTASSERPHIGFFGLRNSGKSSLVNAFTSQQLSLVSDTMGTTTDPVRKTMELLPLGPVVIIDTPGIDDEGMLGQMRVDRAMAELNTIDIAVLVVDITKGIQTQDQMLIDKFKEKNSRFVIAYNKCDLTEDIMVSSKATTNSTDNPINLASSSFNTNKGSSDAHSIVVSAKTGANINALKELVAHLIKDASSSRHIIADLISPGDIVVLVVPIDSSAPKGRLILPQQMTIRDILEAGAISVVTRETELQQTLDSLGTPPAMVITDSQAFGLVSKIVPKNVPLTSFSILMMRYKGDLDIAVNGANALDSLKDGDTVLISEGCTHHRQCEDIGTVKLPAWIKQYTDKEIYFEFTSGREFPTTKDILSKYALVVHCGGCMLTEKEVKYRMGSAIPYVPFTNYGVAIAKVNGILERSLSPLHKDN